jgi:type II secretory pathway component PulF
MGSSAYRRRMKEISQAIDQGASLAESFSQSQFFPPLVVATIKAGEQGGRLDQAFRRLADHYENLVKFRTRFLMAIGWPVFELCAAITIFGLLILIMGYLLDGKEGLSAPDWFGFGLKTRGNFILYVSVVMTFFTSIALLVIGTARGWYGTLPMRIARRIPVLGKTIECLSLARMAWTMAVAENAGMSATETMQLSLEATQNYYYEQLTPELVTKIQRGQPFYLSLQETQAFPDDFLIYVDNGETAGKLAEVMEKASDNLQETAENNLRIISVVGFVVTFGFVAILVGFTIISIYSQYLGTLNSMMR